MQNNRSFKVVALLPIKKHSARLSGKNFRLFGNEPLFTWILKTLMSLEWLDLIIINTDAAALLRNTGLQVFDKLLIRERPESICGDDVSMNKIIENDLDNIKSETYLMTHATNPLLSSGTITTAFNSYRAAIENGSADSLFTVNRHQARFYLSDGTPVNHDPNNLIPTQALMPWYEENSCLYIFSNESFSTTGARIGRRPALHTIPRHEAVDIDDQESWTVAEMLLQSATKQL